MPNTVKSEHGALALFYPEIKKTLFFTVVLFVISVIIFRFHFLLFHTITELIGVLISFTIAIIAYNTYNLPNKLKLTFLGISFSFVGIFSLLHLLTFNGMGIFENDTSNISSHFNIISKYLESISLFLLSIMSRENRISRIKPKTTLYLYSLISIIFLSIVHINYRYGIHLLINSVPTGYKILHDSIITVILTAALIIFLLDSKLKKHDIYIYVVLLLILKIASQMFFIFYENIFDTFNGIGHILRLICFYCMYKALIETSLRRPVGLLFKNLNDASMELQERTLQLQETNQKLVQENIERRLTEAKLLQSNERYKQLLKILPEGLFLHSDGVITFANPSALQLLGASNTSEVIGKSALDFMPVEYHDLVIKRMQVLRETGFSTSVCEEKLIRIDGITVDIEVISAPVTYNNTTMTLSIVRDITERKRTEELKRSIYEKNLQLDKSKEMDKIKTEFFSNISHELRTPLNLILSTLQISKKYLEDSVIIDKENKLDKCFSIINQNCHRLLRLVTNLIDATRIDAGYMKPCMRNCNIISTIEDITLSVSQYIESKGISLIFDTDTEEKIMACDPEKIERIMLNILSNATKFTKAGGSIFVNICDEDTRIIVTIKDTGIGIPPDKHAEIFDRFKQVDQSLTRNHEGSGIGLSLVKSLIEMHNGNISLESEPGKGSTFIIELPVTVLEDSTADNTEDFCDSFQSRKENIKIEFSDI